MASIPSCAGEEPGSQEGVLSASVKAAALLDQLLQGLGEEEKRVAGVVLKHCLSTLSEADSGAKGREDGAQSCDNSTPTAEEHDESEKCMRLSAAKLARADRAESRAEKDLFLSAAAALRHHLRPVASRHPAPGTSAERRGPCCSACSSPACGRVPRPAPQQNAGLPSLCDCACPAAVERTLRGVRAATAVAEARVSAETEPRTFARVTTAAGAAATAAAAAACAAPDFLEAACTVASNLVCAAVRAQLRAAQGNCKETKETVLPRIIYSLYCGGCTTGKLASTMSRHEQDTAADDRVSLPTKATNNSPLGRTGDGDRSRQPLPETCEQGCDPIADLEDSSPLPLLPTTFNVLLTHAEQTRDEDLLLLLLAIAQEPSLVSRSAQSSPRRASGSLPLSSAPDLAQGSSTPQNSLGKLRPFLTLSDSSAIVVRGVGAASAGWRGFCVGSRGSASGTDARSTVGNQDADELHESRTYKHTDGEGLNECQALPFKMSIFAPAEDGRGLGDDGSVAATRTSTMNDGGNVPLVSGTGGSAAPISSTVVGEDCWGEDNVAASAFPCQQAGDVSRAKKGGFRQGPACGEALNAPRDPRSSDVSATSVEQFLLSLTSDAMSTTSCSSELSSAATSSFTCVCGRPSCPLCCCPIEEPQRSEAAGEAALPRGLHRVGAEGARQQSDALVELLRKAHCMPPPGLSLGGGCAPSVDERGLASKQSGNARSNLEVMQESNSCSTGDRSDSNAQTENGEGNRATAEGDVLAAAALLKSLSLQCGRADPTTETEAFPGIDAELAQRLLHFVQVCGSRNRTGSHNDKVAVVLRNGHDVEGTKQLASDVLAHRREGQGSAADRALSTTDCSSVDTKSSVDTAADAACERVSKSGSPGTARLGPAGKPRCPKATPQFFSVPTCGYSLPQSDVAEGEAGRADRVETTADGVGKRQEDLSGEAVGGAWADERGGDDVYRYGVRLRHLGSTGKVKACWTVWSKLKNSRGLQPNAVAYGCMYDALVSNGRVVEALELFEEMKREGQVLPNTIMYSTIIKGFAQSKQLDKALKMYAEMQQNGVAINIVTFNSIVDACARVGAMDKAAMLLEDMLSQGIKPDLITFSTIIKGYCVHGEMNKALHLLKAMRERQIKPDGVLYNSLLDGCVKTGRVSLCEYLWEEMQREEIPPSNFTLTILIKMHGRLYQLQKAFELVKELPRKYGFTINAHVYTCLMAACIVNREYSLALEVYDCMERNAVRGDPKTLTTIVGGCIKGRMIREAVNIVERALDQMAPSGGSAANGPGGDLGPSQHCGMALVDEKTLRFVVQQTKELGLPLVHKAIRVGLLRGRNAATALHVLGSSSAQSGPLGPPRTALGGSKQRNSHNSFPPAPPRCQLGSFLNDAESLPGNHGQNEGLDVMSRAKGRAGACSSVQVAPSSLPSNAGYGACSNGANVGYSPQFRQQAMNAEGFTSYAPYHIPSAIHEADSIAKKLAGNSQRGIDAQTVSGNCRYPEQYPDAAVWRYGSSVHLDGDTRRGALEVCPDQFPGRQTGGSTEPCADGDQAPRPGSLHGVSGDGFDGSFLPTLLSVHLSSVSELHANSQQGREETVSGHPREFVNGRGISCASGGSEMRPFGMSPFPGVSGSCTEVFTNKLDRRGCELSASGGDGANGREPASRASAVSPLHAQPFLPSPLDSPAGTPDGLAGSSPEGSFGLFSGPRADTAGKERRRNPPQRRRGEGGHQMLFNNSGFAMPSVYGTFGVSVPFSDGEGSSEAYSWRDGLQSHRPRRFGAGLGPADQLGFLDGCRRRARVHPQPPPPPHFAGAPHGAPARGAAGNGYLGGAGRRRRQFQGHMWRADARQLPKKEGC
ncbi:pentatricopeptide repeat-containing protein At5g55840, related [Neospora caninum Liverpool]|uniref:Pentatricopeptide repeat-containing protein At5g55840, related n=1 Tax=Neospora caninum (strain Liverpool) TaxID=572307 RepID=F0V933_NEOCL|nr:pentatricopeptide repeat-containing protein At5g55840, related [Neospora caninum Liverpool]CBZ50258.1 pentatricopeptide repeat-containing protein At5g55840, related [Neospora caninum Liverpool]CEL64862.1 TPA: Pentatricopeptide repeat-containing protein At5g55840, related [Neospora caninum Liverpool]|eukprot:XP_003880292.1 pentatricopeptide repeat-containing protein At5g55840, related [Neospora caninum Liverpool]